MIYGPILNRFEAMKTTTAVVVVFHNRIPLAQPTTRQKRLSTVAPIGPSFSSALACLVAQQDDENILFFFCDNTHIHTPIWFYSSFSHNFFSLLQCPLS